MDADHEKVDTEEPDELEGKHVVPYEEWVASEENVTSAEEHKVPVNSYGSDLPDSQKSDQDIFAEEPATVHVSNSEEHVSENVESGEVSGNIISDNTVPRNDDESEESTERQGDNLFEKMGFPTTLTEPSAEEMFDEMIRSSTPNATLKPKDETEKEPSEDNIPQSQTLSDEPETSQMESLSENDTTTEVYMYILNAVC